MRAIPDELSLVSLTLKMVIWFCPSLSKCMIHTESCSSMSQVQISVNSGLSGQIMMFWRPTQFNTMDWTKGRSSTKQRDFRQIKIMCPWEKRGGVLNLDIVFSQSLILGCKSLFISWSSTQIVLFTWHLSFKQPVASEAGKWECLQKQNFKELQKKENTIETICPRLHLSWKHVYVCGRLRLFFLILRGCGRAWLYFWVWVCLYQRLEWTHKLQWVRMGLYYWCTTSLFLSVELFWDIIATHAMTTGLKTIIYQSCNAAFWK